MSLLSDLKSSLQQLGLQIYDRKCQLYGDSLPRGCTLNVSTTSERIEVLGIPVGKKEYAVLPLIIFAPNFFELCFRIFILFCDTNFFEACRKHFSLNCNYFRSLQTL